MVWTHGRVTARSLCGCVGTILASACATGHAQTLVSGPTHYLSIGAIYSEPDDNRLADYGTGGSIGYGHRLGEHDWVEARLANTVLETGATTAVDFYQTTIGLDYLRSLGNERGAHVFVLAGLGVALNDVKPDSEDASSAYFDAAIGWRVNASENWGVRPRVELRLVHDTFASGNSDLMLTLAFEIPPRSERIVQKTVFVEKIVEVPVEIEKIVEREVGCDQPGAQRPAAEDAPPSPSVDPSSPPVQPAAPDDAASDDLSDNSSRCTTTAPAAQVDVKACALAC